MTLKVYIYIYVCVGAKNECIPLHYKLTDNLLCRFLYISSFGCSDLLKHDEALYIIALIKYSQSSINCRLKQHSAAAVCPFAVETSWV